MDLRSALIVSELPYSQIPVDPSLCLSLLLQTSFSFLADHSRSWFTKKTCCIPGHQTHSSGLNFCNLFHVSLFTVELFSGILSARNWLQTSSECSVFSVCLIVPDFRKTLIRRISSRARRLQKITVKDFSISFS